MSAKWTGPPPRVLVVDDDESVAEATAGLLDHSGFEVATVSSPLEALAVTHRHAINLVIADYHLPNFTGVELARELRANGVAAPILFISGDPRALDEARALDLERTEVLAKPFTAVDLNAAVWRTLGMEK